MAQNRDQVASLFTQVDISAGSQSEPREPTADAGYEILQQMLAAQDRQNELLEELIGQLTSAQRQRNAELAAWKEANPTLAKHCRKASEALSRAQIEFLSTLTEEIELNGHHMMEGEFMLTEFVDRFGPRLAHLNGVLQVLSQLGTGPVASSS